jgi:uncharacterized damage-inducible protein DinB
MQHADWANRRVLDLLNAASVTEQRTLLLFAHILTAERIYLERMRGLDPWPQDFWPELSLAECAALAAENRRQYEIFFDALAEADLDHAVKYRNSKGAEFHTPIKDLLTHVTLHGVYHRGQIAAAVRAAGGEPVHTDFIAFVREGY